MAELIGPTTAPVLLGVRQEDYPLQLAGFMGEGAQALGIFENRRSGETLLLRAGGHVASLGLEVTDFKVVPEIVALPESMSVRGMRAVATVRETGGRTLELREGITAPGTGLVARIRVGASLHELSEGATLPQGAISYRVTKIQLAPASVDVTKESTGDGTLEQYHLLPHALPDLKQP
ncbi:MAG: hypothetical protein IT582_11375 [Opitutaceae bacterium]|nr:hypothetical protein [Opitutaceae bacterium]